MIKIPTFSRFSQSQDGSILIFVLVVFSTMFLVGGAAIDFARNETQRTTMQYNLDRAVLAAASLKQTKVPDDVVADYMSKVHSIEDISVVTTFDVGLNYRSVSATATAELRTMFLRMAGIDSMPITVVSAAEERIPHLEISLVLDVSGSMGNNSKLTNLKVAAKEFITSMLTGVDDDHVAISIIPFNNSVAPSETVFTSLNVNETHNFSTCLDFAESDFDSVNIDPLVAQDQLVYTSLWGGWSDLNQGARSCFTDDYFQIMPYSDNEVALHTKIDSFVARGWTAGHLGMKWGTALLDPSFRPVTADLIAALEVDAGFAAIPAEYTDNNTLKVVILMGDGANTYEFRMGPDFKGSGSDLWDVVSAEQVFWYAQHKYKAHRTSSDESKCSNSKWVCFYKQGALESTYYLQDPTTSGGSIDNFYDIQANAWISTTEFNNLNTTMEGWISTTQMDWEDAWGLMPAQWYDGIVGGSSAYNDLVSGTGRTGSEGDTAMAASCEAARGAGLVVYTIGFETDVSTSAKLASCASTPSHYYDAAGVQISAVFAQIAASIQKLKLTQ
ncbi:MAG: hypothetical protein KUG74_07185 [Rhodobacteraceae bacterium]|nr:hypothetical protein [Paracoccaceae bacterium]